MLASVNYIKVKAKEPLHLDKKIECDGILIEGKVDIATEEKLGVVRVIEGNGLHITDGSTGIKNAGNLSLSLATDSEPGAMSPEDKKLLQYVYNTIIGFIPQGTARFNGKVETVGEETIDYETVVTDWEGIVWICDLRIFAAYKTITTLGSCNCSSSNVATVHFTYYPHWTTEDMYMENPGEYEGLWKDKAYIYGGNIYVWKNCEEHLVKVGGTDFRVISPEEIDELFEDFIFVDGGSGGSGITYINAEGEYPLTLEATPQGTDGYLISGNVDITSITAEVVKEIFNDEITVGEGEPEP